MAHPPCSNPHSHSTPQISVRLCQGCELPIDNVPLEKGLSALCPRCGTKLYKGGVPSLSGNLAIAVTCLLLFIPSHFFDFISIRLFGVMIPATLPNGIWALIQEGFPLLAVLIFFCSSIAPLILAVAVISAHVSLKRRAFKALKLSLSVIQHIKSWAMIDVFLVSVAISCFKLQDYSDIFIGTGLYGLVLLQLATVLLVTRVRVYQYWEVYLPESSLNLGKKQLHCHTCHLSQPDGEHCSRCHSPIHHRKPHSIQKTWAYLIAASVAIFPANLMPISILLTNGQRLEDTIFSGVASLVNSGMTGIAIIIFVASIVVPVCKILGLSYILLAIKFKRQILHKQRMYIFFLIKWIGRWSMMDLFVISIMMTLLDRGQILDFTPGLGAIAFGLVVVLTMLATESLDPRLIWDNYTPAKNSRESLDE